MTRREVGARPGSKLIDVVADPRLDRLWRVVHERIGAAGAQWPESTAYLRAPSDDERAAVDLLLGTRSRARDISVPLALLDDLMRGRAGSSLHDVVSRAVGPLEDRPAARAKRAEEEEALRSDLFAHPALARWPEVAGWMGRLWDTGQWRKLTDPRASLRRTLDVLAVLPADPEVGRSQLAAAVLGDAHALDDSAVVGRLVSGALAALDGEATPATASRRRQLWARAGVLSDDTSSTVLTAGLRPVGDGPATEAAARWADSGLALPVPLAAVRSERWRVPSTVTVWVCENPAVLSAVAHLGQPVVCVEGHPSLAAVELLRSLGDGGADLVYHGDFGAGGISIANAVIGTLGARPWRFSTEDHAAALARAGSTGVELRPIRPPVPPACWDPDLAPAILRCGVEVEEELVLDLLVDDIALAKESTD
jgi:uncharacterized protein (TIGR02679 family)